MRKEHEEYLENVDWDAESQGDQQIADAIAHIHRDPSTLMHWPFAAVDELTGPMGAGEVWFTAAMSGGGKTTFVVSAVEAWRAQGKRIYILPLELEPFRFRTYLACMATGIHPGDALSGKLRADPLRASDVARLTLAVREQKQPEFRKHVRMSEQRAINVRGLEEGLKKAKIFGADVVIVDHIDHIAGGDGTNLYAESVR
jgi:replicative DNA helicase